ncbi:hypothetical protein CCHR01_03063 [Colletotrichum chrysophilum]|uniref:Uncharacterized protein n=1 Tax=Colletotrichum chrysophilum TaxID=1836956 RepID=A0AAD9ATN4_9PEZI|nr:hypothetical protein K456DRAFT_1547108 [Colletotrichum gloeosporioides 23]KAK1854333.1 hypothetical protein CCHR01_03063 [Colletotrichum chrysophilum]
MARRWPLQSTAMRPPVHHRDVGCALLGFLITPLLSLVVRVFSTKKGEMRPGHTIGNADKRRRDAHLRGILFPFKCFQELA